MLYASQSREAVTTTRGVVTMTNSLAASVDNMNHVSSVAQDRLVDMENDANYAGYRTRLNNAVNYLNANMFPTPVLSSRVSHVLNDVSTALSGKEQGTLVLYALWPVVWLLTLMLSGGHSCTLL